MSISFFIFLTLSLTMDFNCCVKISAILGSICLYFFLLSPNKWFFKFSSSLYDSFFGLGIKNRVFINGVKNSFRISSISSKDILDLMHIIIMWSPVIKVNSSSVTIVSITSLILLTTSAFFSITLQLPNMNKRYCLTLGPIYYKYLS